MAKAAAYVVGVDLGGTYTQVGVVDARNRIVGQARPRTLADEGIEVVIDRLCEGIEAACRDAGVAPAELGGIGVGAPSPIDADCRIIINAVNLRWTNVPLADLVSQRLSGVPTTLDNDVNVAVWGEYILGAGRGHRNVLGMWVGTGIGGGLVIEGRLHHGSFGTAGEIGQGVILPGGGPASEKLEEHAARSAMERRAVALLRANEPSSLRDAVNGNVDDVRIDHIAEAIEAGDALALRIGRHSARMVGIAAANAATLLSLDCVVLGGGGVEALGEWYLDEVRRVFDRAVFPDTLRQCAVVATQLRENAGLLGAALLARQRLCSP